MKTFSKRAALALVGLVATLRNLGLWRFPNGINTVAWKYRVSVFVSLVAQRLAVRHRGSLADASADVLQDPFLRFNANYSLTHVELNTPCPKALANDLGSVIDLRNQKVLCLGARNLDEIFQLQLNGARAANITAVDLYSNIPEIQCMDFHKLEFPENTFDVIFWAGSFAYAHSPDQAFAEAVRVLRKPGYLALGDTLKAGGEAAPDGATKDTYLAESKYIQMQPDLAKDLSEIRADQMTHKWSTLENVEDRFFRRYDTCSFILRRVYEPHHFNVIAKFGAA